MDFGSTPTKTADAASVGIRRWLHRLREILHGEVIGSASQREISTGILAAGEFGCTAD